MYFHLNQTIAVRGCFQYKDLCVYILKYETILLYNQDPIPSHLHNGSLHIILF